MENGRIAALNVIRGASCGVTWEVIPKIIGLDVDQAVQDIGLKVQYLCHADPSGFDPVTGKSPVHFAGKVHSRALKTALKNATG